MPIQLQGTDGVTVAEVDSTHRSQRVGLRPLPVLAWSSFGMATGILTTGLAAGACLFSLRNTGSNLIMIRRVSIGFVTTTAFTAAQRLEFGLYIARGWTGADSGGSALSAVSGKHKATLNAPSVDARVALTTGLTVGTPRALDASPIATAAGGSNGLATGMPQASLFSHDAGDYPLFLAQNEGIVINSLVASGAAGAFVAYPNIEIGELLPSLWTG